MDRVKLIHDVIQAINASKLCMMSFWKQGELARIWKGGCIIHDVFLDRIKKAYDRNPNLPNLLVDPGFAKEIIERQSAWRRVVSIAINSGISTTPGMSSSLAYFHAYRRSIVPANLVQAQGDFHGARIHMRGLISLDPSILNGLKLLNGQRSKFSFLSVAM